MSARNLDITLSFVEYFIDGAFKMAVILACVKYLIAS